MKRDRKREIFALCSQVSDISSENGHHCKVYDDLVHLYYGNFDSCTTEVAKGTTREEFQLLHTR